MDVAFDLLPCFLASWQAFAIVDWHLPDHFCWLPSVYLPSGCSLPKVLLFQWQ